MYKKRDTNITKVFRKLSNDCFYVALLTIMLSGSGTARSLCSSIFLRTLSITCGDTSSYFFIYSIIYDIYYINEKKEKKDWAKLMTRTYGIQIDGLVWQGSALNVWRPRILEAH